MELLDITVFYLEMHASPAEGVPPAPEGVTVIAVPRPTIGYYRFLYDMVGRDYRWLSRRKMSDQELANIIHDPCDELYVLHAHGNPAGFAELDCRQPDEGHPLEVELVQFGIMPEFHGQGLGSWFLRWTIQQAWSHRPGRVWLHTCTLDHAAALPLYQKAGFVQYREEQVRREW